MLHIYGVSDDRRSGSLVRLLSEHEPQALGIHAVTLFRRHRPLALQRLLNRLAQRFGGPIAPWDIPEP